MYNPSLHVLDKFILYNHVKLILNYVKLYGEIRIIILLILISIKLRHIADDHVFFWFQSLSIDVMTLGSIIHHFGPTTAFNLSAV